MLHGSVNFEAHRSTTAMASPRPSQQSYLAAPSRPFSPANPSTRTANRSPGLRQTTGSATQTITDTNADPSRSASPDPLVLRLRGAIPTDPVEGVGSEDGSNAQRRRPRIQWAEDVIDNEGLGRKRSKVCCIYHKPRAVGESSDESSDSSDSDSNSDSSGGGFRDGARPAPDSRRGRPGADKNHDGDDCDGHDHNEAKGKQRRRPSPNAYEKMPKYDVKPLAHQPGTSG